MTTAPEVLALLDRMEALADEIADPYICRTPAYGAPGLAHCAACCYGTGYIVTCAEDEAMMDAAKALRRATDVVRDSLVDEPSCEHRHVAEGAAYPSSPSGRCAVIAVCEDCGEMLGQTGWDSVL